MLSEVLWSVKFTNLNSQRLVLQFPSPPVYILLTESPPGF